MSSGPDTVTTINQQLPFLNRRLQDISRFAGAEFQTGKKRQQSGVDPNLIGQGRELIGQSLAGDFLSPDSNPFLQQTFDRAADLTRGRLASEFAGSGRNLGAAIPARSEELQTLSANIFGNNFQAERDRQLQALQTGLQFDPLNLFINRLSGIIPGAGGISQQPVFNDKTGQIIAGLTAGAGLLSDRRAKKNINRIGSVNGYDWYSFEYTDGTKGEGVMSDEVPQKYVMKDLLGYDMVNYSALLGDA